jgi:hypothetical protein
VSRKKLVREIQAGKVVYRWHDPKHGPNTDPESDPSLASEPSHSRFTVVFFSSLARILPFVKVTLWTGAAGLVALTLWIAIQTLINPDAGFWLNQFFDSPKQKTTKDTDPQTFAVIEAQLRPQGYDPSSLQGLDAQGRSTTLPGDTQAFLVPLTTIPTNCSVPPCAPVIRELRLYRGLQLPLPLVWFQPQKFFRLQQKMVAIAPTASQILESNADPRLSGLSGRRLHFDRLSAFDNPENLSGQWFSLSGSLSQGSAVVSFGSLFYFDPQSGHLTRQMAWHSNQGKLPQWQEVVGGGWPELVVNQSVGLEPGFQMYTLQRSAQGSIQLKQVSLVRPALNHPSYRTALTQARGGLWSNALTALERLQAEKPAGWSPNAEQQVGLIRLHAQVTRTQAQQPAMNMGEQVWSQLINGDWELALQRLEQNPVILPDIQAILQRDSGRFQQRLAAALAVNPKPTAAILWKAILLNTQKGQQAANTWLGQQPGSGQLQARWRKLQQGAKPAPETSPGPEGAPDSTESPAQPPEANNSLDTPDSPSAPAAPEDLPNSPKPSSPKPSTTPKPRLQDPLFGQPAPQE